MKKKSALNRADVEKQKYQVGELIGSGGFRDIYSCASDSSKILKFDRYPDGRPEKKRSRSVRLFRSFRAMLGYKSNLMSGNREELLGWEHIVKAGLSNERHFTKVFGLVETDRGVALMTEKVENFWNLEARSVKNYLEKHKTINNQKIIRAINAYFEILRKENVSCFADRPENMGIVVDDNGDVYIKCFDVKSYVNKNVNPINNIDYFKKKRSMKRIVKSHIELQELFVVS